MIPVEKIILEGPDLSGKTTLFNRLHQATNFKWNIQDRSTLSMLVYAKLYNRDQFCYVENLNKELNNRNEVEKNEKLRKSIIDKEKKLKKRMDLLEKD